MGVRKIECIGVVKVNGDMNLCRNINALCPAVFFFSSCLC